MAPGESHGEAQTTSRGGPDGRRLDEPEGLSERVERFAQQVDGLRDRPASALLVAVAVATVVVAGWWLGRPGSAAPVEAAIPLASSVTRPETSPTTTVLAAETTSSAPATLLVHVAGAVARPGIVQLEAGDRIGDAVTAAGGPTDEADLHRLNLAAPVADGLQIRVPVEGEVVSPVGVPAPGSATVGNQGGSATEVPVNVNTAGAAELETLPGIGPSLAAAIIEWRAANGPFLAIEGLLSVTGIGPAKLAGLADHIVL